MPIDYRIDHKRRLVVAKVLGTLTDEEVFGYQRDVWSRGYVAGYNELMDMSEVENIVVPSTARMRDLAQVSAEMDIGAGTTKFAIVAPTDYAFGLGRMYQAYRELEGHGTKQVGVFRSMEEALEFLGIEGGLVEDADR